MKTITVSRKSWLACFASVWYDEWNENVRTLGDIEMTKLLNEQYGIDKWRKSIDPDEIQVTFTDEKKMIYWLLRWS